MVAIECFTRKSSFYQDRRAAGSGGSGEDEFGHVARVGSEP